MIKLGDIYLDSLDARQSFWVVEEVSKSKDIVAIRRIPQLKNSDSKSYINYRDHTYDFFLTHGSYKKIDNIKLDMIKILYE